MPLYLTGGGDQDAFRNLDRELLKNTPKGSSMLVLPFACDPPDYQFCLERAEECFAGQQFSNIELCSHLESFDPGRIPEFEVIFIEGGNTFQLIKTLRDHPLFSSLKQHIQQGGSIYADSAGAIILGSHVRSAFLGEEADEDLQKLQDYRGLNLVDDWSIHCHHEPTDHEGIEGLLYELGSPMIALPEPAAIMIDGAQVRTFGQQETEFYTFTGHRSIPPGDETFLDQLMMAG